MSVRTFIMNLKEPVSGRQFARMVGQSEGAVRKAAKNHSILDGRTADGKFIPEVAAREWGKIILPEYSGVKSPPVPVPKKNTAVSPKKTAVPKRKPVKEKPEPVTADEFLDEIMNEGEEIDVSPDEEPTELSDRSPKHEAERRTAIFKARMAELAYQEKKGEMIPRSKMKVLFEYGATIRSAVKNLRNVVLDDIIANANDRQVASMIFDEAVDKMLEELSDPEKLNL